MKKYTFGIIFIIILLILFVIKLQFYGNNIQILENDINSSNSETSIDESKNEYIKNPENQITIKSYDIFYYSEENAAKILYKYLVKEIKKQSKEIQRYVLQEHKFSPKSVRAFEYDLNGDGQAEILGIVPFNSYFGGKSSMNFFILQKIKNNYIDLSNIMYSYQDNICILASKTDGYNDIQFKYNLSNQNKIQDLKNHGYYNENLGHIIKYNINTQKYNFKFFIKK